MFRLLKVYPWENQAEGDKAQSLILQQKQPLIVTTEKIFRPYSAHYWLFCKEKFGCWHASASQLQNVILKGHGSNNNKI